MLSIFPVTEVMAEDNTESTPMEEVRVIGQSAQAILGNDTITTPEIEQRNPINIRDVFAGESSITTSGGADIATKVYVNGIEESLLSVSIDGARQNKSAFHHTGNVLLDPSLLKAVKITKGLAPADAGPGALGGSLAYETKDAADLLETGDNFGSKLLLTAGNNSSVFRGNISMFGRSGGFEYVVSGARSLSNDYDDGSDATITGTEADLVNGIGKLAYTSDQGHRFEFSASKTEDETGRAAQTGPGGGLFIRPDFLGVVGRTTTILDSFSKRRSYTLTYTTENSHDWFNPTFQLTYNEQEIDAGATFGRNESFSGTFKNEFEINNGFIVAGLDFFDEKAIGNTNNAGGTSIASGSEENDNIGIFVQAVHDLGSRFSVSYGARYDWQDFTGATGSGFSDNDSDASLNGSIDIMLTDSLTLNAGYGWTWGGYELGEAALVNLGTWTYDGFTTSRANTARIGLRYELDSFAANVAVFNTDINEMNAILPTGGNRGATSDIETTGLESGVSYIASNWFAKLNYTFADVNLNGSTVGTTAYYFGRPVGHIFALEAGWEINNQFFVGSTAEAVLQNDNVSRTNPLPGYAVLDLYGTYQPQQYDNIKFRLDIQNLLDKTYSSRSSDGIDSTNVVPITEPGRRFMLTANFDF